MLHKQVIAKISKSYASYALERRKLFAASDEILALSKQAIFALHRDDAADAARLLREARVGLDALAGAIKRHPNLAHEGPFRAALEEYAEALQFNAFIARKPMGDLPGMEAEAVLGGLADCVGEIARKAVQWATERKFKDIQYALASGREIVSTLIGMNLTGYLRPKLDQAKQGLRRVEDVAYDVSMHRGLHPSDFEKDAFGD